MTRMSEILFAHSRLPARTVRLRTAAVGALGGLLVVAYTAFLGMQAIGAWSSEPRVQVYLPTVGDTLGINSDVNYRGMRVGRVIEVDPGVGDPDGPSAEVLVEAEHAESIPAGVHARVLPGTLFGGEYVDLVTPGQPAGNAVARAAAAAGAAGAGGASGADGSGSDGSVVSDHLADGDVVPADTSRSTIRLMDTLEATQRLLSAVDPAQVDAAVSELAGALDGRGDDLNTMIRDADGFLSRWADLEPQVMEDLGLLAENADLLADVEPAFVAALEDSLPLARTVSARERQLQGLLTGTRGLLDGPEGVTAFLRENRVPTARLLDGTAATLEAFAERHPAFAALLGEAPRLLANGAAAVEDGKIQMEGVLGLQFLDPYDAEDCPRYRGLAGSSAGGR